MLENLLKWDRETLVYLNNLGSEKFDAFWLFTTSFMTWIPFFLFLIILIFQTHNRKHSFWIMLSFLSMLILLTIAIFAAKYGFERLRPVNEAALDSLLRVFIKPSDYSFFSGHAASSFSIVGLSFLYLRSTLKWSYLLFIWPLLFSFSRLYLGVHYPLDILVGALVGLLFARIFYKMHQKFRAPYIM